MVKNSSPLPPRGKNNTSLGGLILQQMELGPMQNFLYFLGDPLTREIAVVDPAWDVDFLRKEAKRQDLKITCVLLTHGHPDHVNGLEELLSTHNVPVYVSQHEAPIFKPKGKNIRDVHPHEKLKIGGLEIECLHTPGHSPGCQCFWVQGQLISGDTLFIDGCGRCDLPGSDPAQMHDSLYNTILKLPDSTLIYPGHNYGPFPSDTLANQKKTNPYLQCHNLQEFLEERMGISL